MSKVKVRLLDACLDASLQDLLIIDATFGMDWGYTTYRALGQIGLGGQALGTGSLFPQVLGQPYCAKWYKYKPVLEFIGSLILQAVLACVTVLSL